MLDVIGVYVPSRGTRDRRNVEKRRFQNAFAAAIAGIHADNAGTQVIISGHMNVVERDHRPQYPILVSWSTVSTKLLPRQDFLMPSGF